MNGRVVRDRILSSATSRTLQETLPLGSAATCLLILSLPHESVDVNVHPAKAEVRFVQPGMIHDLVRDALRGAITETRPLRSVHGQEIRSGSGVASFPESGRTPSAGARDRIAEAAASYISRREGEGFVASAWRAPAADDLKSPADQGADEPIFPRGAPAVVGHYRNGYILAQDEEGLILVDQHAAHERILFEQLASSEAVPGSSSPVQALLFPRSVNLPPRARAYSDDLLADLSSLGFEVESFGSDTLIVRGVPAPLRESDPAQLVLELLSDPEEEGSSPRGIEGRRQRMLATAACHAAVKVPAHLTFEKIAWILGRLLTCESPLRCPHGRPTMLRWAHRAIERRFGRP